VLKTTLIFLTVLAVILGVFSFFAVFGNSSGTYAITPSPSDASSTGFNIPSSSIALASSTMDDTSSSFAGSSSDIFANASGTATSTDFYGSAFPTPALSWTDGGATFDITAVALQGTQLSFTFTIQMGASPACVPLDLRLVADESGDLQGPATPSFSFPDSGNCNGAANEMYTNQTVNFTVDPANLPFLFTTGGPANIFFEVVTTTANGLNIDLPSTAG
jgi:hypothetical protein